MAFCLIVNPLASGRAIANEALAKLRVQISKATVNRLAQEMHFDEVYQQKQESLSQTQRDYRVYFCKTITLWSGYMLPWVFTDECMLAVNPERRRLRVLRGVDSREKFVDVQGYPKQSWFGGVLAKISEVPWSEFPGIWMLSDSKAFYGTQQFSKKKMRDRYGTAQSFVFQQDVARPHTLADHASPSVKREGT